MAGVPVRVGVAVLPEYPGPQAMRIWRQVEDLGVAHAWTFDHLSWRTPPGWPWFDALATLAAAAVCTSRIQLGTLVCTPNFRHPVGTAAQAMTLDHLSGGRFVLGLGAGVDGPDGTVLGQPAWSPGERATRFEEFVALTDRLLRQESTTYRGMHFQAVGARMAPGCLRRPRVPFAVAATGPRGMRLAARHAETWVTNGTAVPGTERQAYRLLAEQHERFTEACEQAGRDAAQLRRLVLVSRLFPGSYSSPERFADIAGHCGQLGFTDLVVNYPRTEGLYSGDVAAFERALGATAEAAPCVG
jgi:alkanesulfonate monooxygenase SsuD/methylene tetrahydromethanopterin reductase-like flavin-dependent oxidoreductase (luciferase family)